MDASADIKDVLNEMESHRIRRLPVIENKRMVGMISEADLAR
ncbi:CBS domain-containing protein, partial [Nocardia gipuzkoensis]